MSRRNQNSKGQIWGRDGASRDESLTLRNWYHRVGQCGNPEFPPPPFSLDCGEGGTEVATLISKAESSGIRWSLQSLIRGEKLMHTAL